MEIVLEIATILGGITAVCFFMDYFTTKKLVEDYFIPSIVNSSSKMIKQYIPNDDPLENVRLVLLSKSEEILLSEDVYANSDEGLKRNRTKCIISYLNGHKQLDIIVHLLNKH